MNEMERRYYDWIRTDSAVTCVLFNQVTLHLAKGLKYTPDFYVVRKCGDGYASIEFHETKGRAKSNSARVRVGINKYKTAGEMFQEFTFILVGEDDKGWYFERYEAGELRQWRRT
jgi:hypothetical protein